MRPIGGMAKAPGTFEADSLAKRETLELVRAYAGIQDPEIRKRLLELTTSMGNSDGQD